MNAFIWITLMIIALVGISALLFIWGAVSLKREEEYEDLYKEIQNQIENLHTTEYVARRIFLRLERLESLSWKNDEKTEVLWDNFYKKFGDYI